MGEEVFALIGEEEAKHASLLRWWYWRQKYWIICMQIIQRQRRV
ncbi:MAG: hypothetical protein ACLVK0_04530 [Parabacteroides merdae]